MSECDKCKYERKKGFEQPCNMCARLRNLEDMFEPKSKTNADRIRSMTDEELARLLCEASICKPTYCPAYDCCINHKGSMYEWLQKDSEV